jgi:tetratricopeptide (TPR) repeat protein
LPIKHFSIGSRLANAPVSFVTYLEKTFWPHDLAIFYPFPHQLSVWQVSGATILMIVISVIVILMMKRLPYLFVGWIWYMITLLPVIGIIQSGEQAMADRYHYLPSIGIAVALAWGLPSLVQSEKNRRKILFPVAIAVLTIMAVFTWQQCGYWKNSAILFNHVLRVTEDNYLAYNARGITFGEMGQYERAIEDFNTSIALRKDYADAYSNKGFAYHNLGEHQQAIKNYNEAIRLRPDRAIVYYNRALVYTQLGQYLQAFEDYSKAISLKADYVEAYTKRAFVYLKQGYIHSGCQDAKKACELGNCTILEDSNDKGLCR